MKALTLIRPMAAAIVHGSKRIENRPRPLPKTMQGVRTVVAVHAGKKSDQQYEIAVNEIDGVWEDGYVGDFHAAHFKQAPYYERFHDQGIVGLMVLSGFTFVKDVVSPVCRRAVHTPLCRETSHLDPWFSGPYGYEILAAVAFEKPIPCRGMLGWWNVPPELEAQMPAAAIEKMWRLA